MLVVGAVIWKFNAGGSVINISNDESNKNSTISASQTVVVSDKISEYKNDELGFSVKYPTTFKCYFCCSYNRKNRKEYNW
jgi:hypothetical protein